MTGLIKNSHNIVSFGCSNTYGQGLEDCYINNGPGPQPSSQAWPAVLAREYNCSLDNKSIPGASNLQILDKILNHPFNISDLVIIMWATPDRDYIFPNQQLGVWQDKSIIKHWLATHTEQDLIHRSWLYIHHASLYLKEKQIPFYNFYSYSKGFPENKPELNIPIRDINLAKRDYALDKLHMGPSSHVNTAMAIKKVINEN